MDMENKIKLVKEAVEKNAARMENGVWADDVAFRVKPVLKEMVKRGEISDFKEINHQPYETMFYQVVKNLPEGRP
jgi:hypothetical protein